MPACAFLDALVAEFPRAKVILTYRDPAAWYDSALRTLYRSRFDDTGARRHLTGDNGRVAAYAEHLIWQGTFNGRFEDREYALSVLADHERRVRTLVPAERLLEFRAEQGWGPLCDFLEVPVPPEPYPRDNNGSDFHERVELRLSRGSRRS